MKRKNFWNDDEIEKKLAHYMRFVAICNIVTAVLIVLHMILQL